MFCEKCGNKLAEDNKFCASCGSALFSGNSTPLINTEDKKKYKKRALIWLLIPVIAFFGIIIVWGIVNVLFQSNEIPDIVVLLNTVLIPFFIGLTFIFSPISIIFAIYYYLKSKR